MFCEFASAFAFVGSDNPGLSLQKMSMNSAANSSVLGFQSRAARAVDFSSLWQSIPNLKNSPNRREQEKTFVGKLQLAVKQKVLHRGLAAPT